MLTIRWHAGGFHHEATKELITAATTSFTAEGEAEQLAAKQAWYDIAAKCWSNAEAYEQMADRVAFQEGQTG